MRAIRWLLLASAVLSFTACGGGASSDRDTTDAGGPAPQCNDHRDNDGDGKIDYPDDPGCYAPNQNDETDHCPDGSDCPQCSNGKDDDGNGLTDYPADTGCVSAADNDEYPSNPQACGASVHILSMPPTGAITGMLMPGATSNLESPLCGGSGGTEDVYELRIHQPSIVVVTTDLPGTSADTIVYIRGAQCAQRSSELGCNDNATPDAVGSALTQLIMAPGTYYIVVDDRTGQGGAYQMSVTTYLAEGDPCTSDECGPGLVCRVPMGATDKVCSKPVCSDGVDDDGDGKADYPRDPGCKDPSDNDETDHCPSGADCPKCSNNVDDDNDTKKDYPADPSCSSAASDGELCKTTEAVAELVGASTLGDNSHATDDFVASCASSTGGKDLAYEINLPQLWSFSYQAHDPNDANTFETAMVGKTCGGTELACSDGFEPKAVGALAAGTYFIIVDADDSSSAGPFTLTVAGTIAGGASCEGPLAQSGALVCATGYTCGGPSGARTCMPTTQCNDGIDNNGDGKIDYPADPGCTSPTGAMEVTVCPGASCPVCSNGSDDDSDMKKDFPADFGCSSAAGGSEAFCALEKDPVATIAAPTTSGTLAGLHADLTLDCNSTSSGNFDKTYVLELPELVDSLTIDTLGSTITDTILQLSDAQCGTSVACSDDAGGAAHYLSVISLGGVPAGNYAVTVKAYSSGNNGAFKLNIHGTVGKGKSCTGPLFTANVLRCDAGTTCTSGKCQ